MIFISPPLAALTLKFGPWENFGVTVFALTLIASLCGKNIYLGLLSALWGMPMDAVPMTIVLWPSITRRSPERRSANRRAE